MNPRSAPTPWTQHRPWLWQNMALAAVVGDAYCMSVAAALRLPRAFGAPAHECHQPRHHRRRAPQEPPRNGARMGPRHESLCAPSLRSDRGRSTFLRPWRGSSYESGLGTVHGGVFHPHAYYRVDKGATERRRWLCFRRDRKCDIIGSAFMPLFCCGVGSVRGWVYRGRLCT